MKSKEPHGTAVPLSLSLWKSFWRQEESARSGNLGFSLCLLQTLITLTGGLTSAGNLGESDFGVLRFFFTSLLLIVDLPRVPIQTGSATDSPPVPSRPFRSWNFTSKLWACCFLKSVFLIQNMP